MRAVVQRVSRAAVTVAGETVGSIGVGLVALVGVARGDTERDADWLSGKIAGLRVFADESGKMNRSVEEAGGEVLAVSQFTLVADCRKGRRPSFIEAAGLTEANDLYLYFCRKLSGCGLKVAQGRFQAHMDLELVNSGPVTIILDSRTDA